MRMNEHYECELDCMRIHQHHIIIQVNLITRRYVFIDK